MSYVGLNIFWYLIVLFKITETTPVLILF